MRLRILNRQNSRGIILVHGLFTNSGFWLNYIKHFETYKVFLLDIEYAQIKSEKLEFVSLVDELVNSEQIKFIIGHSFGALFLDYCKLNSPSTIGINPPHFGDRKNSDFIKHVMTRYAATRKSVISELKKIYNEVGEIGMDSSRLSQVICCDSDEFFEYPESCAFQDYTVVSGNHFEIPRALSLINKNIKNYVNQ